MWVPFLVESYQKTLFVLNNVILEDALRLGNKLNKELITGKEKI